MIAHSSVHAVLNALVLRAIYPKARDQVDNNRVNTTTLILQKKIEMMPRFLRLPMIILIFFFDWYGCFFSGMRFHRQKRDDQIDQIKHWKRSCLFVFRDFIQFNERLSFFIFYSLPET